MKTKKILFGIYFFMILGICLYPATSLAQEEESTSKTEKEESEEDKDEKDKEEKKTKKISEVVKSCTKFSGLFNFYQDTTDGKLYMEISNDKLNNEFIHFFHVENGAINAGWVKGSYGWESIFKVRKYFDRIEIVGQNPYFYYDPESPLSKSADANINEPVMGVEKIVAMNESRDTFLISADKLFMTEAFAQLKYLPSPTSTNKNPFKIGNLSDSKTKIGAVKNYPENSDIIVDYVYENPYPTNFGISTITDPRYISIQVQHSLIQMPENDYEPRYDDPRVGYFTTQVTDQTATGIAPYRDLIHRWHLKKKNPAEALSEPVEPIVFWMENTTPTELRPIIKKAVEAWNIAYEKAGFKNAVVVKQQPDDADWDAGDLRYNVLRWTATPFMGSAWGPSFVNPRTGQILGADIMLDFVFMRGWETMNKLFGPEARSIEEILFQEKDHEQHTPFNPYACEIGAELQKQFLFGKYVGRAMGLSALDLKKMEEEQIIELLLHEVGHTLGLNHNFRSSQLWSPEEINNKAITEVEGLTGSVMDYNPINLAQDPSSQGQFLSTVPGPYDRWAIEYGYSLSVKDKKAEKARLEKILSRSTEPQLTFGNDADAMGYPGWGIDPTIVRWDMSNDIMQYGIDRINLCRQTMGKIQDKLKTEGKSYQEMRQGYNILMGNYYNALNIVAQYIGGVRIDRAKVGQPNGGKPFTPVPYQEQKKAMNTLITFGFSPTAFLATSDIYNHLQIQRRGFDFFGQTEDPKIHDHIAAYQNRYLAQLMHPTMLKRMTDTRLYGNDYSVSEMLGDLTDGIFQQDLNGSINTVRQNLQISYVDGLIGILNGAPYDNVSKSAALYELQEIRSLMKKNKVKEEETVAHRDHVTFKIEKALDLDK